MFKNQKAFTLIEMLVVLMIVSVLMILIIPNLGNKSQEAQGKGCDALVSVVQAQIDTFYLDSHTFPASLNELVNKGYIRENQKQCSNNELVYNSLNGTVSAPENE
ncbi:prepilin-type N-terminal cleavage/methylation domain-containing protein [Ornithinibacillus sp. BX22]|uniref:ComG operon protein 3 n=1 Tax=Ornithinibacillus hominis TaxID=2763055 RepID=A0A923L650_9BACI|nr:competence type IV pilus major pilin ComGC [Ornithinibacillus hominis]MBC5637200.1 prepilin-type N-terminal cleavage/methylation domain-containing protein [Ornithinibacillus hominis]